MSATTSVTGPAASEPGPVILPHDLALPLRATDFDAGIAQLLHQALMGAPRSMILTGLCQHLARVLKLRLAVLARRQDSGAVTVEGASAENSLWLELQRIPERWDSGVSSHGPAGEAVNRGTAIQMRLGDEGFALWRAAADAEHVREIVALPIVASDGLRVVEMCFDGELARGASYGTLSVAALVRRLGTFLEDLRLLEQQQLVARALTSAGNAAFITDLEGTIVWSNPAFSALSGYSAEEVHGRNPNLLRSGKQGLRYYRELWGTIRAGEVWSGETVDRGKDGQDYSIHQTVSPVSNDGRITHYVSIHQDIGRQKQARERLERASRLDPATGLLTPAAFDETAAKALADAGAQPVALVLVSLRGLQRGAPALGDEIESLLVSAMGQRVRETLPLPDIVGGVRPFEYAMLLRGDVSVPGIRARMQVLGEKLAEPVPYAGDLPDIDLHFGIALATPGTMLQDLRLKADRQLANEPYKRAHREGH